MVQDIAIRQKDVNGRWRTDVHPIDQEPLTRSRLEIRKGNRGRTPAITLGLATFIQGENGLGKSALLHTVAQPSIERNRDIIHKCGWPGRPWVPFPGELEEDIRKHNRDRTRLTFMLEQPEVYLHPKLQYRLGHAIATHANRYIRFIVETHSDYIMDAVIHRICRNKGDSTRTLNPTKLKPEDFSLLSFEKDRRGVSIHTICIDGQGNRKERYSDGTEGLVHRGHGRFFMQTTSRTLGF